MVFPRNKYATFRSGIDGEIHVRELEKTSSYFNRDRRTRSVTYRVLEFLYHEEKAPCAHANIVVVIRRLDIDRLSFAIPDSHQVHRGELSSLMSEQHISDNGCGTDTS